MPDAYCGRWAQALAEGVGPGGAAETLAHAYWHPVYVFFRASGLLPDESAVRTESVLARLLTEPPEPDAVPHLREWMRQLCHDALAAPEPRPAVVAIDRGWAEARFKAGPTKTPDESFLQRWALTVLEFTLAALEAEYLARGEEVQYRALQPFLGYSGGGEEAYERAAEQLRTSVSATRVAVFELRKAYRATLKAQIAETVAHAEAIDPELTALLCTL